MSKQAPDLGMLRELWRYRRFARRQLRLLLGGVALRFGELAADLAAPWPLALVIDHALTGTRPAGVAGSVATAFGTGPVAMLIAAAVAVLVITMLSGAFDYLGDRSMNSAGERITSEIRAEVFHHMLRLPMCYHDRQAVGELTTRVATDTGRIEDGMVDIFSVLIPGLLSMTGFAAVLLTLNWRLGLVALAIAPVLFFSSARYTRLTRQSARRRRTAEGEMSGFVAESLQGVRTVHAFGRHSEHDRRFAESNEKVLGAGLRAVDLRARFTPILESVSAIGTASLLFLGGYGALRGWWTVGVLVIGTSYLRDMLKPLRAMSKLALTFTNGAASAERVAAVLDSPRRSGRPRSEVPNRVTGAIELRNVVLDYGRGAVLEELNVHVRPGDRVALLGPNGAGKSSILSLIAGLYEPSGGQVCLDAIPITEVADTWLHRQVAVLLQDTYLFAGSLADNIRYGRPDATDEDVCRAAEVALVTEFSATLPEGLGTLVDSGGTG
ncbi:MAG TPA: ABC transporter ATP-binding protein, partial [Pseudonocardiaceae bacterium]|nr:ABC transporter ATP-binding protein [Pseudonocardiaceae bacterium]